MRVTALLFVAANVACGGFAGAKPEVHGGLELVFPQEGETVPTLPAAQRVVLAKPNQAGRRTAAACEAGPWRESAALTLSWKVRGGEAGPWRIRLAVDPELKDGSDWWLFDFDLQPNSSGEFRYALPRPNLEPGRRYWWRVWSNVKCAKWTCGSATGPNGCACGATGPAPASEVRSFVAADTPPRWISLEGRARNIRDLGGWRTSDGRRVRYGMAFRGEAMNDNSVNGDEVGRNRLTVEDVKYLTNTLGMRTDLDLRTLRESAGLDGSPMGPAVRLVRSSAPAYKELFTPEGMKAMAANFRIFCDRANYPVFFHCIGGADRTGSLAYVLNGVLGVAKEDLERDWESTFYPMLPDVVENRTGKPFKNGTYWRSSRHFDEGFAKYAKAGDSLKDRIQAYLLDCGVTEDEIRLVRELMLESGYGAVPPVKYQDDNA